MEDDLKDTFTWHDSSIEFFFVYYNQNPSSDTFLTLAEVGSVFLWTVLRGCLQSLTFGMEQQDADGDITSGSCMADGSGLGPRGILSLTQLAKV